MKGNSINECDFFKFTVYFGGGALGAARLNDGTGCNSLGLFSWTKLLGFSTAGKITVFVVDVYTDRTMSRFYPFLVCNYSNFNL
jgi:hypothetical protein